LQTCYGTGAQTMQSINQSGFISDKKKKTGEISGKYDIDLQLASKLNGVQ